jgi:hypothetical protein
MTSARRGPGLRARACEEAIALDPDYALAHAVLVHARSLTAPRMEVLPESRDVTAPIQRALELAPDGPGVQHAYAVVLGNMGRTADAMTVAMEIDVLLEGLKEGPIVVDAEYKKKQPGGRYVWGVLRLEGRKLLATACTWTKRRSWCRP